MVAERPRPLRTAAPQLGTGEYRGRAYLYGMRQHPEPRPRDNKDAAQDIARDLADIARQLASLKGEANAWLRDPDYDTLKLRLESAHPAAEPATVEARRTSPGPMQGVPTGTRPGQSMEKAEAPM
jgi:hypothetical protein